MLMSCVLVSHGKEDLCHEAIQSVINQIHQEWELIVFDSGLLYDKGYFESFSWSADERLKIIRSSETEETRRTKAMAPWCYNEAFRNGLVKGDLVCFTCDDDVIYPDHFQTFVSFAEAYPEVLAMYSSQDIGVIYPNGWRAIVGERRAIGLGGNCCNGRIMDCQVDGMQMCYKWKEIHPKISDREWWNESKGHTESHADGILMETIGRITPFYPIDIKTSQNRRTPKSLYNPSR